MFTQRLIWPITIASDKALRGYHHGVRLIRGLVARELCPNCFDTFSLGQAQFRCETDRVSCPHVKDDVWEGYWKERLVDGKVIVPTKSTWFYSVSAPCGFCKRPSRRRICPNCHADLPRGFGSTPNITIAVIGAPDAGKSHYIAVLVHRLSTQIAPALGMSFSSADEATRNRYRDEIYKTLFDDHQRLPKTATGAVNVKVQKPLVYVLKPIGEGIFRDWFARSVTLSFFDSAGEDFGAEDKTSAFAKHVIHCDGLILLIDPTQMEKVRRKMTNPPPMPRGPIPPVDILQTIAQLMEKRGKVGDIATIRVPLAIAATKFDAVKDQFPKDHRVHAAPEATSSSRADDAQCVSTEVEAQLLDWEQGALVSFVKSRFADYHYFALSALGAAPDERDAIAEIKPHRVEDALIWLLARKGVL